MNENVIHDLSELRSRFSIFDENEKHFYSSLSTAIKAVKEQKRKGHWIRVTDKAGHLVWECDKCGWQQRFNTNFCPDCGAKMACKDGERR